MTKEEKYAMVRKYYPTAHLGNLAQRMGMSIAAVRSLAKRLNLKRTRNVKNPWTKRQLNYLNAHYQDTGIGELAEKTQHSPRAVYAKASMLGLCKTKEYMAEFGYMVSNSEGGKRSRFQKGHTPANKGKKMEDYLSEEKIARVRATQFKKGDLPWHTHPVGFERMNAEGYIFIKVAECRRMVLKHRWLWEQAHGPIPDGYCVGFKDGDRHNFDLENLYLLSRADCARMNIHNETPERRQLRIERCHESRKRNRRRNMLRMRYGLSLLQEE